MPLGSGEENLQRWLHGLSWSSSVWNANEFMAWIDDNYIGSNINDEDDDPDDDKEDGGDNNNGIGNSLTIIGMVVITSRQNKNDDYENPRK